MFVRSGAVDHNSSIFQLFHLDSLPSVYINSVLKTGVLTDLGVRIPRSPPLFFINLYPFNE